MPAHNPDFPWTSYYGHYNFFEARMLEHDSVLKIRNLRSGLYELKLSDGREIRVFICECYSFSSAEYQEVVDEVGKIDAVVINSAWCGYTSEVKLSCQRKKVGVFDIAGFMAALNIQNFWEYMTESERKRLK